MENSYHTEYCMHFARPCDGCHLHKYKMSYWESTNNYAETCWIFSAFSYLWPWIAAELQKKKHLLGVEVVYKHFTHKPFDARTTDSNGDVDVHVLTLQIDFPTSRSSSPPWSRNLAEIQIFFTTCVKLEWTATTKSTSPDPIAPEMPLGCNVILLANLILCTLPEKRRKWLSFATYVISGDMPCWWSQTSCSCYCTAAGHHQWKRNSIIMW